MHSTTAHKLRGVERVQNCLLHHHVVQFRNIIDEFVCQLTKVESKLQFFGVERSRRHTTVPLMSVDNTPPNQNA